jgi:hypothetical protein
VRAREPVLTLKIGTLSSDPRPRSDIFDDFDVHASADRFDHLI